MFHAIAGRDEREASSPSWFNIDEAKLVKKWVDDMVTKRHGSRIAARDIGVISPYRKQVQRIRMLLNATYGQGVIKVGSVEVRIL